jgi:ubiquinone/menaquinone biosynthesis C-methylase UbiE
MLERVLEAEVMESMDEAISYDDMCHDAVNEQFVTDLLATGGVTGEILDLGTGTARIPLLLCEAKENCRIVAVDLSTGMLDIARLNVELASQVDRILLSRIDAKSLPFDDNRFDAVMSNSIVHHLATPESAFAEAHRVCSCGGLLFFRDLMRPATDAEVKQLVTTYAGEEAEPARRMFDDSLRAALTVAETREIVAGLGFPADSVQATSDRHWTWCARKPAIVV